MKKILVVLGGGGHTKQMIKLVDSLGKKFKYDYVISKKDKLSKHKIKTEGEIYEMSKTRGRKERLFSSVLRQFPGSIVALKILIKSKPDIVLACGPNFSVPICFVGKILGKKIIFLESWSRIYTKSLSGRFVYLFADLFFVQWPEMKKLYKKAIYAGRLI